MIKEMPDDELIMILASILCDQDHTEVTGTYRYESGTYKLSIEGATLKLTNILTNSSAVVMKAS